MGANAGAIRASSAFVEIFAVDNTRRGIKSANQSISGITGKLNGLASGFRRVGLAAVAASGVIAAGLAASVREFAEFDDRMRFISATGGFVGDTFNSIETHVRKLGASTSHTATQIGEMAHELTKGGIDSSEDLNMITTAVQKLARATETDGREAAKHLIRGMKVFGLTGNSALNAADAYAKAANSGVSTFEDIAQAMGFAGRTASMANMTLEETLAVITALGNVGITGSRAGTGLRRVPLIMAGNAEQLQELFGVSFKDKNGDLLNILETTRLMGDAVKDLGSAERAAILKKGFGLLGFNTVSLLTDNFKDVDEILGKINNSFGTLDEMVDKIDGGIGGAFRILKSAWENLKIVVGEIVSEDHIIGFVKGLTMLQQSAAKYIQQNPQLINQISAFTISLGATGAVLIATGVGITGMIGSVVALGGAISVVSSTVALFTSLMSSPALIVGGVAGFVAITAAVQTLATKFNDIIRVGKNVAGILGESFSRIASDAKLAFQTGDIEFAIQMMGDSLRHEFDRLWDEIPPAFERVTDDMVLIWRRKTKEMAGQLVIDLFKNWGNNIGKLFTSPVNPVGMVGKAVYNRIYGEGNFEAPFTPRPMVEQMHGPIRSDTNKEERAARVERNRAWARHLIKLQKDQEDRDRRGKINMQRAQAKIDRERVAAARGERELAIEERMRSKREMALLAEAEELKVSFPSDVRSIFEQTRDQLSQVRGFMGTFSAIQASRSNRNPAIKEIDVSKRIEKLAKDRNERLERIEEALKEINLPEFE